MWYLATHIFINYNITGDLASQILEKGEDNLIVF